MKKFLVLNVAYQPLNPAQYGFAVSDVGETDSSPYGSNLTLDEDNAKKFAEHMASSQGGAGNQKFHVVEIKGIVKAKIPVEWSTVE